MGDDRVPRDLERAVEVLRELPEARAEWRRELLDAVAGGEAPRSGAGRVWRVAPWMAAAAALAFMMIGAAGTYLFMRQAPAPIVAQAEGAVAVSFSFVSVGATSVALVGDFNEWDPTSATLQRAPDGKTWTLDMRLTPGRYAYAFLVDGALVRDPSAPQVRDDDFGSANSVVLVRGS